MKIQLYVNNSDPEVVDKNLTKITLLSGTLRDSTDVVNPVIRIEQVNISTTINYAYIEEFGRFYFINDIGNIRTNLWELSFHVDVLMTYRDWIRNQIAVIKRQENLWNLYLDDGTFKAYQDAAIITKTFPQGFTTESYVLALAGST